VRLGEWVLLKRGRQRKGPTLLKRRYFTAIGSYSVKTVIGTDMLLIITSTGNGLFKFIDDLERP